MTDPIADMLTRIRNASAVGKAEVVLPMSKIKHQIANILKQEGWIHKVEIINPIRDAIIGDKNNLKDKQSAFKQLRINLKYKKNKKSIITSIKRISKPGLRVYVNKDELPRVLNNFGIAIISTSQGLMTNKKARRKKIGGEVICEVY